MTIDKLKVVSNNGSRPKSSKYQTGGDADGREQLADARKRDGDGPSDLLDRHGRVWGRQRPLTCLRAIWFRPCRL